MNGDRSVPRCVLEDSGVSCGCDWSVRVCVRLTSWIGQTEAGIARVATTSGISSIGSCRKTYKKYKKKYYLILKHI